MAWAIHRFETILFVFTSNPENVLFIFEIMSRNFPKLRTVHVWADNLTIASNFILPPHQLLKSTVNNSAVRIKQCGARRKSREME